MPVHQQHVYKFYKAQQINVFVDTSESDRNQSIEQLDQMIQSLVQKIKTHRNTLQLDISKMLRINNKLVAQLGQWWQYEVIEELRTNRDQAKVYRLKSNMVLKQVTMDLSVKDKDV